MTASGSRAAARPRRASLAASVDAGVAGAVLAIGRPQFPQTLMASLRRIADVDHCMVFSFEQTGAAHCRLDLGTIPLGHGLGEAYAGHFHQSDPNRDVIFAARARHAPIVLPTFARRLYDRSYRKLFFDESGIVDKFATAIWTGDSCTYVNFYRLSASGGFSRPETDRLNGVAPAVAAAVARHLEADAPAVPPAGDLGALFAQHPELAVLTGREREVCLRILAGQSSEAISTDLGISIHSTLTYRRRAYERLGISSQNELFALVLRLLTRAGAKGLN